MSALTVITVVAVLPEIADITFIALFYRLVTFDIKIKMVIIDVMTVILVMVVYCVHHNGCNTNVYCFIGCIDYNCLNGL